MRPGAEIFEEHCPILEAHGEELRRAEVQQLDAERTDPLGPFPVGGAERLERKVLEDSFSKTGKCSSRASARASVDFPEPGGPWTTRSKGSVSVTYGATVTSST